MQHRKCICGSRVTLDFTTESRLRARTDASRQHSPTFASGRYRRRTDAVTLVRGCRGGSDAHAAVDVCRPAAGSSERPRAGLSRQRHRRDHPLVVRERGRGAADSRPILRALGQILPHHQRAPALRGFHCVQLPVGAARQSLCSARRASSVGMLL